MDSYLPDRVVMSLRGRVTTEAISYLIDIIEIATAPERRFAMTNDDCDTVSRAGMTKIEQLCKGIVLSF